MQRDVDSFSAEASIASLTPTVSQLFSSVFPALVRESPLQSVIEKQRIVMDNHPVERCLVFCPDALGVFIWKVLPELMSRIAEYADVWVPLLSVFPPKTPVCFASMFTGGYPEDHGITHYEKPVLRCETLFDVLLKDKKKIAIVAVRESSIDLIFRERQMDYYSEQDDAAVEVRATQLINENNHNLIVVYQQEFDDLLHKNDPFSDVCIQAAHNHVRSFQILSANTQKAWRNSRRALIFAPDHGAHIVPDTGLGDHGLDIPEDMHLFHWYGLNPAPP